MKVWWKSKANWTAIATFVGGLGPILIATSSGLIGDHAGLILVTLLAEVSAVLQFAIRTFYTTEPIGKETDVA